MPDRMTPERLADLVIRKKQLDEELKAVREIIKRADIDLPFALQRGDNIVVVKKPAYVNGMPSTEVIPLLGLGCSS